MVAVKEHKKLTRDDRYNILGYLSRGDSISTIAKRIGFNKSTIYRELHRCSQLKEGIFSGACKHLGKDIYICNQCPKK